MCFKQDGQRGLLRKFSEELKGKRLVWDFLNLNKMVNMPAAELKCVFDVKV